VLAELRAAAAKPPSTEVEAAHLAAMAQLARGIATPGSAGGGADLEAWRALAEVTALSAKPPAADVEVAHLGAMGKLSQAIGGSPEPVPPPAIMSMERPLTHRRLALGLVGPALALPLCVATLAAAGVGFPEAVRAPLNSIGIGLSEEGQSRELSAAIQRDPNRDRGCIFDQDVGVALGLGRARLDGRPCSRIAGTAGADHRTDAARGTGGPGPSGGRHPVVLARAGEPPAAGASADNLVADATPGQASPVLVSVPSGGAQRSRPSDNGHPPRGGGHPAPSPGGGRPTQRPGGGEPSSPPVAPVPSSPPVALATRPGKGCGDKNHVHERADECK
jgi:hypothetical protein